MLTQNPVLQSDRRGNFTHVQGVYSDISQWKKSEHQIASIVSTANNVCFFFTVDDSGSFKSQTSLSKWELEL